MIKKLFVIPAVAICMLLSTPVQAEGELKDTYIDADIQKIVYEVSAEYNICPELVLAIIETESGGNVYADNGNCKGLMQIYTSVHKDRIKKLGVTDVYDPEQNIRLGCDTLLELFEKYNDLPAVLMKYNGSKNAVSRSDSGNYTNYCKKVMARSYELEVVHDKAFLMP